MRLTIALLALLLPTLAAADTIYRHVDKQGNVVYTDQPPDGAEEVTLPPINTVPGARKAAPMPPHPPAAAAFPGYQSLQITGVQDGAVLRNPEGGITVSALPAPSLRPGDRIVIRHNGEEVSATGTYTLGQADRGSHTFSAEIVDPDGKVMLKARDVTITVLRTSLLLGPKAH